MIQVDIVLFDDEGSDLLKKAILYDLNYSVLYSRKEIIYLSPRIVYFLISNIFTKRFRILWKQLNNFSVLYFSYLYACLKCFNPKVVITFTDNSFNFQWLSRNYKSARFFAIQNGIRINYCVDFSLQKVPIIVKRISMPNLICFGQYERDLYLKYGHDIDNYYPFGSLCWTYYKTEIVKTTLQKEYDLCLVSEMDIYTLKGGQVYPGWLEGLNKLHAYLRKYLDQGQNIKICIAMRSSDAAEYEYYRKTFGDNVTIIQNNRKEFSTYQAIDKSEITVALASTVAREAFCWGKKVCFCNFTGNPAFNFPIRGIWSIVETEYEQFQKMLEEMREMDINRFLEVTATSRKYLINYQDTPVHHFCRNIIINHIQ